MALSPFRPAGLNRDLYLPSELDIQNRIVSHPNVRSYQKYTAQSTSTVHDTGNPNTDVVGEYSWLTGGRSGAGAGGYNAITDRFRVWFTVPHDEVTWHAGTTLGNRTSWGVEWAFGKDKAAGKWQQSLEVNARLHAAYIAAMNWPIDAAVLHQKWYGKWCSAQILNSSYWDEYQAMLVQFVNEARKAATGKDEPAIAYATPRRIKALDDALSINLDPNQPALTVAPRSVYDPSSKVRFFWVGDRVRAISATPRYQFAVEGGKKVGPDIPVGTEFDVDWLFIAGDGQEWYLTPWLTRIVADDTIRISDAKG